MKLAKFSIIEKYFQYFLLFIIVGIVVDSIYYFIEFKEQINPFYINLFVAISLFLLSLFTLKWRDHLDNIFPRREEQYRNLSRLFHLYDKPTENMKSNELFSQIIHLYVYTNRPLGDDPGEKREYSYIKLDGIQFTHKENQLENKYYEIFSKFKVDLSKTVDAIYRANNFNDKSQFAYFTTKNIEDLNENIENCFKSRCKYSG
ncbi:MAG: hypothetical protein GY710_15635 [Desulfobacteraceae bacterium]|nr:hypothetical protein [Desulfobacteraceae bacterium]